MKKTHKPPQNFNPNQSYERLKKRVMESSNPTEKDWLKLKYEDKMDWIGKHGKILHF
jgi:hypothetical protein